MNHAVILGGTGALGQASASKLLREGWTVDVVGRNAENFPTELRDAGAQFRSADRYNSADLQAVLGAGADLLVDALSFTEAHAKMLLPHLSGFSSAVMLSSKAVYQDEQGRHANSDEPPQFSGPISEEQATLPAQNSDFASREGYGPNKVAAEQLLLDSGYPVTVIRASKVHGIGTVQVREWVFVKRILDERKMVFLARAGRDINHTTAAANTAALIEQVARIPGRRILNCADPDAPSALEICRTVAQHFGYQWQEILLEDDDSGLGAHPWTAAHPVVLDTSVALAFGYRPVGNYAETIGAELDWLANKPLARPDEGDPFFAGLFDYAAEDQYLANCE